MLVFVDESGDSGMQHREGTSRFFVVTAVLFEDHDEATKCDYAIDRIRASVGMSAAREFRFSKCGSRIRQQFLQEVSVHEFLYLAVVIDKCKLINPFLHQKESFYNYTVNLVFQNAKPHLSKAIVVLDKSGGLEFRRKLAAYLKKKICENGRSLLKKVKMEHSHSNNLLQLADMSCGAIARSFREDKPDRLTYRNLIKHRELDVQIWPK